MIEPYTELPAMTLAVVGFIVFTAVLTQAYSVYEEKTFIAHYYEDAAKLADRLGKDVLLTSSRPGIIDSGKLEYLRNNPEEIYQKYGSNYNFILKVDSISESRRYTVVIKGQNASESRIGVSASVPVIVKFNDAEEEPGTITVKIWSK